MMERDIVNWCNKKEAIKIPVIDLRNLGLDELNAAVKYARSSHCLEFKGISDFKTDKRYFNESAGSKRQTYSTFKPFSKQKESVSDSNVEASSRHSRGSTKKISNNNRSPSMKKDSNKDIMELVHKIIKNIDQGQKVDPHITPLIRKHCSLSKSKLTRVSETDILKSENYGEGNVTGDEKEKSHEKNGGLCIELNLDANTSRKNSYVTNGFNENGNNNQSHPQFNGNIDGVSATAKKQVQNTSPRLEMKPTIERSRELALSIFPIKADFMDDMRILEACNGRASVKGRADKTAEQGLIIDKYLCTPCRISFENYNGYISHLAVHDTVQPKKRGRKRRRNSNDNVQEHAINDNVQEHAINIRRSNRLKRLFKSNPPIENADYNNCSVENTDTLNIKNDTLTGDATPRENKTQLKKGVHKNSQIPTKNQIDQKENSNDIDLGKHFISHIMKTGYTKLVVCNWCDEGYDIVSVRLSGSPHSWICPNCKVPYEM